ncbi:hypothetical protein [Diaphorobacter limosus]|uniref:Uncharacterized protein n=1 Tax=Diaphorobacter limosus TaxID=3036128 RepID=A0ABZ0J1W5_9BURK|nr:hypothetical protein [Diaphorobacter sp. Y-1]WOO30843.1 hypothetical protein P4826_10375 [Diaphorobacter sp. Y-1]
MKYHQWMGLTASAFIAFSAHADLLNISSTSLQSSTEEAIACTIIATGGPTYQGYKVLLAFAEGLTPDSNPTLRVRALNYNLVYENDNWQGPTYINGTPLDTPGSDLASLYTASVGRTPGRSNDSATLVLIPPGDAICAFSKEVSSTSLKKVSVAFTDITFMTVGMKNMTTQEIFLLDKWVPRN